MGGWRARGVPGSLETLGLGDNELATLHGLRPLSSLARLQHLDVAANPLVSAAFLAGIDHRPLVHAAPPCASLARIEYRGQGPASTRRAALGVGRASSVRPALSRGAARRGEHGSRAEPEPKHTPRAAAVPCRIPTCCALYSSHPALPTPSSP